MTVTFPELGPKHRELLKQAFPGTVRVAVMIGFQPSEDFKLELQTGARRLGQLQILEINGPGDFDAAFLQARRQHAQALYAIDTNIMVTHRELLPRSP